MNHLKKIILCLSLFFVVFGMFGCGGGSDDESPKAPATVPTTTVPTSTAPADQEAIDEAASDQAASGKTS